MVKSNARIPGERGQMLILFVLALGVLMGMVAMTIDVGLILHERRTTQNAADAGALAAVQELPDSPGAAVAAARKWASQNGYGTSNGATVTVNTPYQGDPGAVEVIIEETTPFLFARAVGLDSVGVRSRAVASVEPPRDYAIFAHAGGCEADSLNIQGSSSDIDGAIHTNSELKINSDLYVDGSVTHVCDADVSGGNTFTEGISQVSKEIDWPAMYAYADFPCTFTYPGQKLKIGNGTPQYFLNDDPGTGTLKPGVYCSEGEIDISASVTGNVTLVAREQISLSCSTCNLTAYWNDVLLFSELVGKGAISLSVSQFYFQGLILAPNGEISANGSSFNSDSGTFLGETVSISASDINITALLQGEEGPPRLVE
jgi:hypothetical protein